MKNKDRVYLLLKDLTKNIDASQTYGLTAEEIARELNIKRNVVSHFLNELCEEGKAIKINTRPVYFVDNEIYRNEKSRFILINEFFGDSNEENEENEETIKRDPFNRLIGYNGSLRAQVEQCKSAVTYPPRGLPILLIGNTGVGKSFMARLIYDYSIEKKILKSDAPFIIFNCAEYANNPELLSANLFGYVKGAFTGADHDKPGLFEEANEGYLFLDEIHRLPPEGQEKLFLFMDSGIFRRLGEVGDWRRANVRLVFATTESIEKNLLQTFLRRIPLVVNIPPLSERPLHERFKLIYNFYRSESENIGRDIYISKQALNFLLKANTTGNIGKLINTIKYSCAHAYNKDTAKGDKVLNIHLNDIQRDILFESDRFIDNNYYFSDLLVAKDEQYEDLNGGIYNNDGTDTVTERIISLFEEYKSQNTDIYKLKNDLGICLNEFSDKVVFERDKNSVDTVVFNSIMKVIENLLSFVENNYGIKYYGNTTQILTYFTMHFLENAYELEKRLKDDLNDSMETLREVFPKEYVIASKMIEVIETNLDIKLDKRVLMYFTTYIRSINKSTNTNEINAIIIAHGYSTASSIASVANRLLGQFVFEAFDMPIEMPPSEIVVKIENYFKNLNTSRGVILLVDMGSLREIYKPLAKVIEGDIGIVNNITTQLAIDVGDRIIKGQTIEKIVSEVIENSSTQHKIIKSSRTRKSAIITTCMTGIGTATKIKGLLAECFGDNVEIIAYDYDRLRGNGINDEIFKNYNIKLIIGTADPHIKDIPYLSLEDLITGSGEQVLKKLLKNLVNSEIIEQVNRSVVRMFTLENVLDHIMILNPDKILVQVEQVISDLEFKLGYKFANDLKISLYIHICNLIERLVIKDPIITYHGLKELKEQHQQFVKLVKSSFNAIEKFYRIELPVSEIGYIYDIINLKIVEFKY